MPRTFGPKVPIATITTTIAALLDLALRLGHRPQDDAGVLVKPLARGGRLHAARLALEQRCRKFSFQIGDVSVLDGRMYYSPDYIFQIAHGSLVPGIANRYCGPSFETATS